MRQATFWELYLLHTFACELVFTTLQKSISFRAKQTEYREEKIGQQSVMQESRPTVFRNKNRILYNCSSFLFSGYEPIRNYIAALDHEFAVGLVFERCLALGLVSPEVIYLIDFRAEIGA